MWTDAVEVTLSTDGTVEARNVIRMCWWPSVASPPASDWGWSTRACNLDERGFVVTDASLRTAEPTIWAVGDVTGEPMLAHKATHQAKVAVDDDPGSALRVRRSHDPGRRVHRPRNRLGRTDRGTGQATGSRVSRRGLSVGRQWPCAFARSPRRTDQVAGRSRRPSGWSAAAWWDAAPAS